MSRILLVDDDEGLLKMLRTTLVKFGHDVFEARNGKEALVLFDEILPDVVMTDIIMPEKDGIEILRDLLEMHPDAKVIAMSGGGRLGAVNYLSFAKAMGAAKVLEKPFSNEALIAAITDLICPTV